MKIAAICTYYPWPPSVGGVETIVRQVSIELAKKGHEVHVVTTPFNAITLKQVSEYGTEKKDGVVIHKLKRGNLRVGYAQLMDGLDEVIKGISPDIVHSNNLHPHLFQLARWKQKGNYKLLAELHYPIVNIESFLAKAVLPFALRYLAMTASNIDLFIAHAEIERKWLVDNGIDPQKVHKIMFPCVPSQLINHARNDGTQMDGDLLFVGRVVWIKGLHVLVKALKLVNDTIGDVKLTIIGPCNERYLMGLKNLIKKLKLNEKVDIRGIVSDEEKYKSILTHKLLVLPSLGDFTPNVILEVQALGMPIIATRVGAVPEIMVDGETGLLVRPGDVEELASAIKTLLLNDDLRRKMSVKAEMFSKNFLPEIAIRKLETLYYGLVA